MYHAEGYGIGLLLHLMTLIASHSAIAFETGYQILDITNAYVNTGRFPLKFGYSSYIHFNQISRSFCIDFLNIYFLFFYIYFLYLATILQILQIYYKRSISSFSSRMYKLHSINLVIFSR